MVHSRPDDVATERKRVSAMAAAMDIDGPNPEAPRLFAHVEMLAGTVGERNVWRYAALQRAAEYIESEFTRNGYDPGRQTYDVARIPVSNIETSLAGSSRPSEIVLLGAHYDTVSGCPGANDNGTGVAALLELSRRFAGRAQPRTIRFVAFVNEEPPFFRTDAMGSLVNAKAARARGDDITAMISLETMGYYSNERGSQQYPQPLSMMYPDVGNFIGFVADVGSARMMMRARRAFKGRTAFPLQTAAAPAALPGVGWSDQWAFWEAGYPGMMVTDTAPFRYPWYHTADDTPDKISADKLAHVVDGLEHVVAVLAGGRP